MFYTAKTHHSTIPRLPTPGTGYGFNASVRGNGGQASFHYCVSEANQTLCGTLLNESAANVHSVVMCGVFHDVVFCALRDSLKSKRANHSFGSAMIVMKE